MEKLIKIMSLVLRFIYKCQKVGQINHLLQAKSYLVKAMQEENFHDELSFMKDPTKGKTPLGKNLNVFRDQHGSMDGKIANSDRFYTPFC